MNTRLRYTQYLGASNDVVHDQTHVFVDERNQNSTVLVTEKPVNGAVVALLPHISGQP